MKMQKIVFGVFLAAMTLSAVNPLTAQELVSAREIVKRYQDNRRLKGYESLARLLIFDKKGRLRERHLAIIAAMSDTVDNTLMRFLGPADVKGTGLLTKDYEDKDDDMWIFLPSLRKSRRIVSSEKSGKFMGSELTFADMSQFSLDDFNFELTGTESLDGVECYVIKQTPVNNKVAEEYDISKKTVYIGKEDYVARKSIAWNRKNKKWKEFSVLDIRPIPGLPDRKRAFHMKIENLLNGRKTEFIFDKFAYNPEVKGDYFSIAYLERP